MSDNWPERGNLTQPQAIEGVVDDMARLNITWSGTNGDLPDPVPFNASDDQLRTMASEAVESGYIPGIEGGANIDLSDFVVDRFAASEDVSQNRIFIRPKTPFGCGLNTPGKGEDDTLWHSTTVDKWVLTTAPFSSRDKQTLKVGTREEALTIAELLEKYNSSVFITHVVEEHFYLHKAGAK